MIYKMTLKDSVDTMTFNLLETPIVDKDIEGAVDNVTLDGNQYTDYLYLKKQYIQKWAIMCPDEYDELRGFYTRQFEEGEVPSYRVYYGANVTRDYTLNGDYLQFNAEGIETGMTLSQLLGNAEQTTYSGKNLASIETSATKTIGGVAFTIVDGILNISSGTTAGYTNFYFDSFRVPNSGASVLWLEVSGYTPAPSDNCVLMLQESADNSTWTNKAQQSWGSPTTQNITLDNTKYYRIRIYAPPSVSFNNAKIKFQLEYGTKTDFEPYTNGASPNPNYPQPISTVTGAQNIEVVGKNLFDKDNANILNAYIDPSHTSITSNSNNRIIWVPCQPNTTYTLQKLAVGTSWYARQIAYTTQEPAVGVQTYSMTDMTGNDTSKTYTTGADAKYLVVRIWVSGQDAETFDAMLNSVQLELGSTATAYEPYQGQSYEINLGLAGKNMLNPAWMTAGFISGSGTITPNQAQAELACQDFIPVEPNTEYTFEIFATSDTYPTWIGIGQYSAASESNFVTRSVETNASENYFSFTTASNTHFIRPSARNLQHATKYMLSKGSRTTYEPYFELCKIGTYQDRIYKDEGKWYIEKQVGKVVLDGSEGWVTVDTQNVGDTFYSGTSAIDSKPIPATSQPPVMSDYYSQISGIWGGDDVGVQILGLQSSYKLRFRTLKTTLPSVDIGAFKTWLSTHPTTVYYALATPTTTEITDEELLLQLNFLASLYKGENNISLVGTGAQGEMEVFIRDVMSVETDVVPEVPVRLTLTDDGVINACGCRRNVQLTMRETTE